MRVKKICEICQAVYMGDNRTKYCNDDCRLTAHSVVKKESRRKCADQWKKTHKEYMRYYNKCKYMGIQPKSNKDWSLQNE